MSFLDLGALQSGGQDLGAIQSAASTAAGFLFLPDPRFEMPELFIPGRKPVGAVEIDWSHPYARDLCFAAVYEPLKVANLQSNVLPSTNEGTQTIDGYNLNGTELLVYSRPGGFDPNYGTAIFTFISDGGHASYGKFIVTTDSEWQIGRTSNNNVDLQIGGDAATLAFANSNFSGNLLKLGFIWNTDTDYRAGVQDGALVESTSNAFSATPGSTDLHIGNRSDGARNVNGTFKYVFIYNRPKSKQQIDAVHTHPYQFLVPA